MLRLRRAPVLLLSVMVLFGATFCLLQEEYEPSGKWEPPEYVATPLVEATRKATFNPEARYISLSRYTGMRKSTIHTRSHNTGAHTTPLGRWSNNLYQLKHVLALGAMTKRTVLSIPLKFQPIDYWLDGEYITNYMLPNRVLDVSTLIERFRNDTQNSTTTLFGLPIDAASPKMISRSCVCIQGFNCKLRGTGSWVIENEGEVKYFPSWEILTYFLLSPGSPRTVILCDKTALFANNTARFGSPSLPAALRYRSVGEHLFNQVKRFDPARLIGTGIVPPWRSVPEGNSYRLMYNLPWLRARSGLPMPDASLGVHWRRGDRIGYGSYVPDILAIIDRFIKERNVRRIVIATDAEGEELETLRRALPQEALITCSAKDSSLCAVPDDQVIVEQQLCMYTDYFLGSMRSTFSTHIQHLREEYYGHTAKSAIFSKPWPQNDNLYSVPIEYVQGCWRRVRNDAIC